MARRSNAPAPSARQVRVRVLLLDPDAVAAKRRADEIGEPLAVFTVPQLDGTFIEVETLTELHELDAALAVVRQGLTDLEIGQNDLTTERYDELVRATTL